MKEDDGRMYHRKIESKCEGRKNPYKERKSGRGSRKEDEG